MNDTTALPIPSGSDLSPYEVQARFEIVSILKQVGDSHALVTLHFNEGRDFIVSTLLNVNPEFEEIVLDCGADERVNERLVKAPRLQCVTSVDHIRIQFTTGPAQQTMYEGHPAFRIRLPDTVLRLQRRNAYRVKVPMSNPPVCHVPHPRNPKMQVKLRLLDISVGGLAIMAAPLDFDLEVGDLVQNCRIVLPDFGEFEAHLEIRNVELMAENSGTKLKRYGCKFVELQGSTSALVQRYILFVERSRHGLR
jgi:flagellar brake protein